MRIRLSKYFSYLSAEKRIEGVRVAWTPFFLVVFALSMAVAIPEVTEATEASSVRIDRARQLVLKGERMGAIKIFKELAKDSREVMPAWREIAEVFLTDKSQNQASLAESIWTTRPKEAVDILLPLLKAEDGNLVISRLGARAALRALDCARAEMFTAQAELVFPSGADVKLLRLQVQDCLNGTNAANPPLKLPLPTATGESEWGELEPALRLLAVKDSSRRKEFKFRQTALNQWEAHASLAAAEDPEFWYWKWRTPVESTRDRLAGRKYLRLCAEMTPRRRKKFAMHPELCLHTESVESNLKSSDKAGT